LEKTQKPGLRGSSARQTVGSEKSNPGAQVGGTIAFCRFPGSTLLDTGVSELPKGSSLAATRLKWSILPEKLTSYVNVCMSV